MNIYLMGYMGSGKSTVGGLLASQMGCHFIDLDTYIETGENATITEIFDTKGEIYFRKKESYYLKTLIGETVTEPKVVALGGGTPCYGNNLQLLQEAKVMTVYLNWNVQVLSKRLWEARAQRPLVAHQQNYEQLEEYVRKHLFERGFYYNQATHIINADGLETETIAQRITTLF